MFSVFNVGIFTSMTSKDSLKALSQVWLSQALHRIPRSNAHAWSINSKRGTIDLIDSKEVSLKTNGTKVFEEMTGQLDFLSNFKNADRVQARLPFNLVIR